MEPSEEKSSKEQRSTGTGPGERLQAERIQQGLSLDDVASRMHLSTRILKAIEKNEFEEITAPIFVKGYLRAYARIVALDEDEMIDQYVDFYSKEDPPITSTSNTTSELSATDPRMKWTTYLVVLVIGVLLAAWWWNQQLSDEEPISLDSQSSNLEQSAAVETESVSSEIEAVSETQGEQEQTTVVSATPAIADPEPEPEPEPEVEAEVEVVAVAEPEPVDVPVKEVEAQAVNTDVEEIEPEPVMSEQEMTASTVETEQNPVGQEVGQIEPDTAEAETSEIDTSEVAAATSGSLETSLGTRQEPSRIAPIGSDKLEVIVHADTWADIKDSNSYQLVYDLLRADNSVELTGEAPFTVFLGNGHGVEIIFNGDNITVAPRIRDDNTARLKIGG